MRSVPGRVVAVFGLVWLTVGLVVGTAILVGPAGWIADLAHRWGGPKAENWSLRLVIVGFVVGSFLLARALLRAAARRAGWRGAKLLLLATGALSAGALYQWRNPSALLARLAGSRMATVSVGSGARFLFGPYPDRRRLVELKRLGVTAVVSLQHPAVPVEVPGILAERQAARELGLRFIHVPMLPWVSSNDEALRRLEQLARNGRGLYYVHCGLGRDRVQLVRHYLESLGAEVAGAATRRPLTLRDRPAQAARGEIPSVAMERGLPLEVERDLWIAPHPNAQEVLGYFLSGQVRVVVSVLDPRHPEQRRWLAEERAWFARYRVPFRHRAIASHDSAAARRLWREIRSLPRPVVVLVPRTDFADPRRSRGVAGLLWTTYSSSTGPTVAGAQR